MKECRIFSLIRLVCIYSGHRFRSCQVVDLAISPFLLFCLPLVLVEQKRMLLGSLAGVYHNKGRRLANQCTQHLSREPRSQVGWCGAVRCPGGGMRKPRVTKRTRGVIWRPENMKDTVRSTVIGVLM